MPIRTVTKLTMQNTPAELADAIQRGPFKVNENMSGEPYALGDGISVGALRDVIMNRDEIRSRADYIVYSYATPIGWRLKDTNKWRVPFYEYGRTSRRHQDFLRSAVDTFAGQPDLSYLEYRVDESPAFAPNIRYDFQSGKPVIVNRDDDLYRITTDRYPRSTGTTVSPKPKPIPAQEQLSADAAPVLIADRMKSMKSWRSVNLKAVLATRGSVFPDLGKLNPKVAQSLDFSKATYIVIASGTPVCWRLDRPVRWVMPMIPYDVVLAEAQRRIAQAVREVEAMSAGTRSAG